MNWPEVDQSLLATLPPVLKAVVRALGFIRAQEWLRDHGGVNVHIPKLKTTALGLSADELPRLREALKPHLDANDRVSMPKADKLMQVHRNAAIIATAHRESIARQARLYDLSSRQITNIRRQADIGHQLDLFD